MKKYFGFSCEAAFPYLQTILLNIMDNPDQALTGPIQRGDWETIKWNLDALSRSDEKKLHSIYTAFLDSYLPGGQKQKI